MPTLEEVYEKRLEKRGHRNRRLVGLALLYMGLGMMVLGGTVAFSSTLGGLFGASAAWERWGIGALFGATGLPVAFTGVFVVVPAPKADRALAGLGVGVSLLGVILFDYAYPSMWHGDAPNLSPLVFAVYTLGSFMTFGALFRSVLDIEVPLPRSSLSIEYTDSTSPGTEKRGSTRGEDAASPETEVPSTAGTSFGLSGGDAEFVQNNAPEPSSEDRKPSPGFSGDEYCGNCDFYEFKEYEAETSPYCGFHEKNLENLEACEDHSMKSRLEAEDHQD